MKPKILVVEDKPENIAAAKECYSMREEYDFAYAIDYDEAMTTLGGTSYTGIITDCFMPNKTGSGNITLGLSLIDRLVVTSKEILDRREKYQQQLQEYKDVLDIDNPLVSRAFYINSDDSFLNGVMRTLFTKSKSSEENTKLYLEFYGVKSYSGQDDRWGGAEKDHAWILEQMMRQTEIQPLGVLIIDYAKPKNIPHFMLSARHNTAGDVIRKWCEDNQVPFDNPTESEKAYSHYWSEGLRSIERQIQDREKIVPRKIMEKYYNYHTRNKADMEDY